MISWMQSVTYDPLGDCSRSNRNAEFWEQQRKGTSRTTQTPQPRRTATNEQSDSELMVTLELTKRNREYRQRQLELLRQVNRTEDENA